MDGTRFDRFTRQFAAPRSRRSVVSALALGLATAAAETLGWRVSRAAASQSDAEPAIACLRYDQADAESTQPCRDAEKSGAIGARQIARSDVKRLDAAVRAIGYGHGTPLAFELAHGARDLGIAAAIDYAGDGTARALLTVPLDGRTPYAILFVGDRPQRAIHIEDGEIRLFTQQVPGIGGWDPIECGKCYKTCEDLNGPTTNAVACGVAGAAACMKAKNPWAAVACGIVAGAACNQGGAQCAKVICELFQGCPPYCDPGCEVRIPETGQCRDLCPENKYCLSQACICKYVTCAGECCGEGEVCQDDACVPKCDACWYPTNDGQCFDVCAPTVLSANHTECCVGPDHPDGVCCLSSETCCNGHCVLKECCAQGFMGIVNEQCCPYELCAGSCCGKDELCLEGAGTCCNSDRICGNGTVSGDPSDPVFCCHEGEQCGVDWTEGDLVCCSADAWCEGSCCGAGELCRPGGTCCPPGRLSPSGSCCDEGFSPCSADLCCEDELETCVGGACCPNTGMAGGQCCPFLTCYETCCGETQTCGGPGQPCVDLDPL